MQSVSEWKNGINTSTVSSSGVVPVSEWVKKNPPMPRIAPITEIPKPSTSQTIISGIKSYAQESADTVTTFGNALLHPIDTIKKGFDLFFNSPDVKAGIEKASTPIEGGNTVTDIANLISGVSQALFSPITGAFKVAENVPGLKQVADVINIPFTATGIASSYATGKIVDALPGVSEETKNIIRQPLQEVGSLAGQIFLGGKIMGKLSELGKKGEEITPIDATKIVEQAKSEATVEQPTLFESLKQTKQPLSVADWQAKGKPVEISLRTDIAVGPLFQEAPKYPTAEEFVKAQHETTYRGASKAEWENVQRTGQFSEKPGTRLIDKRTGKEISYGKEEGINTTPSKNLAEGYARGSSNEGVTIEFKPEAKAKMKFSAKFDSTDLKADEYLGNGLTLDDVAKVTDKDGNIIYETTTGGKTKSQLTDIWNKANKEIPVAVAPKPVEIPSTEQLTSRVFERMQSESPVLKGDLTYNPIKLKEDAQKAIELIATDKQQAFRVAMGAETRTDITSTAVNIAMAEKALSEGNTKLYAKLIKNRSLEQTRRGQELVAERGSLADNSTARYVKELLASRLDSLGSQHLGDLKNVTKRISNKGRATEVIEKEVSKLEKKIKSKK